MAITPSTTTTKFTTTTTARKPTIKRGSKSYTYHVESKSRPGIYHVVDAYRLTCTCEAGRARHGCWHLRLGLAWHDWRKRQQAQPQQPTDAATVEIAA